jgi:hypothetical protein
MKIFLVILAAVLIISCSDEIVSPGFTPNLITNSSFEINGIPSLRGWEVNGEISFFRDTPPEGGRFSIGIQEAWGPPYYAAYSLPAERGTRIYKLSCWAKTDSIPAAITFTLVGDTVKQSKSIEVTDRAWRLYTLTDTVVSSRGDSIKIFLNGSISHLLPSRTYYDRCFLEAVN